MPSSLSGVPVEGPPIEPTEVDPERDSRRSCPGPGGILVEVIAGPMDGESRRVAGSALTIGRAEQNDLVLTLDPSISADHATILNENGQYWLEDHTSTNGTWLGETKVEGKVVIGPGTVFTVGRTPLELMSP